MALPALTMGNNPILFQNSPANVENSTESASAEGSDTSFADDLESVLTETNQLQLQAGEAVSKSAAGMMDDPVSLVAVMEKAQLSLELTVQVRNKAIEAYQEVMRLQV